MLMLASPTPQWSSFRRDGGNSGSTPWPLVAKQEETESRGVRSVHVGGLLWGTAVAAGDGRVYVGSTNRRFCCIDPTDAKVAWTYRIPPAHADTLIDSAASVSPDGTNVVVPGGDGALRALDAVTGREIWEFRATGASEAEHASGVVVNSFEGNCKHSADGTRLYAGCDNASFYCIDMESGLQLWRVITGMMIWGVAALLTIEGREVVVFGSLDGRVYAVDGLTGKVIAAHDTGGEVKASPLAAAVDAVFVCNSNGSVFRLSLDVKSNQWRRVWDIDLDDETYGSPALMDGVLFVTDMSGAVTALSATDGKVLWREDTYNYITGSPVATSDGAVVVGTSVGWLIALSARTGALLGALELAGGDAKPLRLEEHIGKAKKRRALNASPIVLPSGDVVIGSYEGVVYFVPGRELVQTGRVPASPSLVLRPLDGAGRAVTHVQDVSEPGAAVVSLRLHVYDDAEHYVRRASASRVRVKVETADGRRDLRDAFEVHLSADGRFVNLVPTDALEHGEVGELAVTVWGEYREQEQTWLQDRARERLHPRGTPFRCPETRVQWMISNGGEKGKSTSTSTSSVFERNPPPSWDVRAMRAAQPTVLETYIPAALDAQGFVMHAFGVRPDTRRPGRGDMFLLFVPALPGDGPFETGLDRPERPVVLKEPSKVVVLRARYRGDSFQAEAQGAFTFSAMGGTIPMEDFRVFGRADAAEPGGRMQLDYFARASCLGVRGNGSSYSFPDDLVNQLCDASVEIKMVGAGDAEPRKAEDVTRPHPNALVVWADETTGLFEALLMETNVPSAVAPGCAAALFVDGERISERVGGQCHVPVTKPVSADAYLFEREYVKSLCPYPALHPNVVTMLGIVATGGILAVYHLSKDRRGTGTFVAICALIAVRTASDCLDGPIARTCDKKSALGASLDTIADTLYWMAVIYIALHATTCCSSRVAAAGSVGAVALFFVLGAIAYGGTAWIDDHAAVKGGGGGMAFAYNNIVILNIAVCAFLYAALRTGGGKGR
jgi:outer membrane protein assembly factor BamB/phosphatidylglycerophosphate synthase